MAILLGALMPLLSQCLQRNTSVANWVEVCTAQGTQRVASATDATAPRPTDPQTQTQTHLLDHCPYCSLQTQAVGLPPAAMAAWSPLPMRFGLPQRFYAAAYTPHAWAAARPRGPPHLS